MELNRSAMLWLGILTLLGFGLGGVLIDYYWGENRIPVLIYGKFPIYKQLGVGLIYGFILAWLGWKLIETPWLKQQREFFTQLIQPIQLSSLEVLLISICAGVGEELFFRGALQQFLGIWITAILFVAIHGYLNPFSWRMSLYGIFMTLGIGGIGYLTEYAGLVSAISAHTVIDIYLLRRLTKG